MPACDSHVQQVCLWLPAQQAHGGLLLPSFEPPWLPIDLGVNADFVPRVLAALCTTAVPAVNSGLLTGRIQVLRSRAHLEVPSTEAVLFTRTFLLCRDNVRSCEQEPQQLE